jgi:HK97 gp10 family phage protein
MIELSVQITGLDEARAKLERFSSAIQDHVITDAMMAGTYVMEARTKELLASGGRTGRTYARGKVGRKLSKNLAGKGLKEYTTKKGTQMAVVATRIHRASAPGEAPAVDYGTLINSAHTKRGNLAGILSFSAAHAAPLEFGTARMAARPFVRPTWANHRDEIERAVQNTLTRATEELLR